MLDKTRSLHSKEKRPIQAEEILESISDGCFFLAHDWRFIYVNQRAAFNLGFLPQDLVDQNLWEKIPQIIGTEHEKYYHKAMLEHQPQEFDWLHPITHKWYHIRAYPSEDGISVYWQDVTHLKLIEENLQETQELCRIGSWAYDIEKQTITWSIETYRLYERDPKLGPPSEKEDSSYYSPGQYKALRDCITWAIETGQTISYDLDVKLPSKKPAHYYATFHPLKDIQGRVIRLYGVVQDITEHKRTEEALARAKDDLEKKVKQRTRELSQSEKRYHGLVDNINEFIVVAQDGLIKFANRKGIDATRYQEIDLINKPFLNLVYPDDREMVKENYRKDLAGEAASSSHQFRFMTKQGDIRWTQINTVKMQWEGKPALLAILNDITERKNAEEKINYFLGFRTLLTDISSRFVNVSVDSLDQEIQDAQKRLCEYLGLDISSSYLPLPEDPTMMKLTYLFHPPEFPPVPDVLRGRDYFPWCEQQLVSGKSIVVPSTKNLPPEAAIDQASWHHFGIKSSLMFPLLVGDKIIGTLSFDTVREECSWPEELISGLKQVAQIFAGAIARKQSEEAVKLSEEKYRLVVENANEAIVIVQEGMLKYFNPKLSEITGYSAEELKSKKYFDFIHPEDRKKVVEIYRKRISGEAAPISYEYRMIIKDGSTRWMRMNAARVNWEGEPATLNIFYDVTGEKTLRDQIIEYARRITQVQEDERKRIGYELHDDTAQYLSILKMQLSALLDSEKIQSPEVKEKLQYLEKDADMAFNDVRRYSHELRPVTLERAGLIAALEQIVEDYNKLGKLEIVLKIGGEEPKLSEEVKLGFFRIAQEALNNTRKHAKASLANIILSFRENHLEMSITDNGNGFDVREATNRAGGKGSLGLMSMRERADLIGAKLKIESKPGAGTIIKVDKALDI